MKYIKPQTIVIKLQQQRALLTTSEVYSINSTEFQFGGGAYIDARTKESRNVWDEEW